MNQYMIKITLRDIGLLFAILSGDSLDIILL